VAHSRSSLQHGYLLFKASRRISLTLNLSFREDWTLFGRVYLIISSSPRKISLLINSQSTDWGPSLHLQNPFTFTVLFTLIMGVELHHIHKYCPGSKVGTYSTYIPGSKNFDSYLRILLLLLKHPSKVLRWDLLFHIHLFINSLTHQLYTVPCL